jgi:hypothetical protein
LRSQVPSPIDPGRITGSPSHAYGVPTISSGPRAGHAPLRCLTLVP